MPRPGAAGNEELKAAEDKAETEGGAQIVRPVPHVSGLAKTIGVLRTMLPLAQKVLPLIDGRIGTVVSNLIAPHMSPSQGLQTLLPLQQSLAKLEKQQMELRALVVGQNAALEQIDLQLEAVRKLTEEIGERQRSLAAGLEKMSREVNLIAVAGLVLLAVLLTLNVVILVHVRR